MLLLDTWWVQSHMIWVMPHDSCGTASYIGPIWVGIDKYFSRSADMPYNDWSPDCLSSVYKHSHLNITHSSAPNLSEKISNFLSFYEVFRAVSKDIPSFVSTVNAFPVIVIWRGESCGSGLRPNWPRVALPQLHTDPSEVIFMIGADGDIFCRQHSSSISI